MNAKAETLYDKIFQKHLVDEKSDGTALLYIDHHLVHEVTSPQAFDGLKLANRPIRRPKTILAVADHNIPTSKNRNEVIDDKVAEITDVKSAKVNIVFDPPWDKDMMSEEAKLELGFL